MLFPVKKLITGAASLALALTLAGSSCFLRALSASYGTGDESPLPVSSRVQSYAALSAGANAVKKNMLVVVPQLSIYGDTSLTNTPVMYKSAGSNISVSSEDGIIYCVYSESGIIGYCRGTGLISPGTRLYYAVPAAYEQTVSEDEAGNPVKTVRRSLLADVNEYAYNSSVSIAVSDNRVFVQREIMTRLEKASADIASYGVKLIIEKGYSAEEYTDEALSDCTVSARTGALLKLSIIDGSGAVSGLALNDRVLGIITGLGLTRIGESDWFYAANYEEYLPRVLDSSTIIRLIYG